MVPKLDSFASILTELKIFSIYLFEDALVKMHFPNIQHQNPGQSFAMPSWIECTLNYKDPSCSKKSMGLILRCLAKDMQNIRKRVGVHCCTIPKDVRGGYNWGLIWCCHLSYERLQVVLHDKYALRQANLITLFYQPLRDYQDENYRNDY